MCRLAKEATIVDQSVTTALATDYKPPVITSMMPTILQATWDKNATGADAAVQKAEDVVSSMLAKGFILGKDTLNKAKAFDESHQFTSTAAARVASFDQKIGLSDKLNAGTVMVNDKVREMDQKFQVSEKTKIAVAAAEQTISSAGSAIMKNRYVITGASWVTGPFNRVAKVANEVGQKTKDKVLAEEEQGRKLEGYEKIQDADTWQGTADGQSSKPQPAYGFTL